jgi:CheY-like chemotaxis protein
VVSEGGSESHRAQIRVRDTGRGIDPALLDAVFGMFVQGRSAQGTASSGLGVGLALTRSIVELHHGTVEAKSEGPGRGSEFIINLPIGRDARVVAPAPEKASPAAHVQKRVLVVDDNVDAAVMLSALVSQLGHESRAAYDGAEALAIAEGYRPEVVLLDLGMPGMDGLEVARRLRARTDTPQPRIIAVTGWGKGDDRARTREAGFDFHLVKPADETQLRLLLENGNGNGHGHDGRNGA